MLPHTTTTPKLAVVCSSLVKFNLWHWVLSIWCKFCRHHASMGTYILAVAVWLWNAILKFHRWTWSEVDVIFEWWHSWWGFDHVLSFWVEYETPSVPEAQWHFQCALWLQEESNDTLQPVWSVCWNYAIIQWLPPSLNSQVSKFYTLLRRVLTI